MFPEPLVNLVSDFKGMTKEGEVECNDILDEIELLHLCLLKDERAERQSQLCLSFLPLNAPTPM